MSGNDVDIGVGKSVFKSRTVWAQILSAAIFAIALLGYHVDATTLAEFMILYFFFINLALRIATKEPIVWE